MDFDIPFIKIDVNKNATAATATIQPTQINCAKDPRPCWAMELAERDKILMHMQKQREAKEIWLKEKMKTLSREKHQNEFLEYVTNDYRRYYDAMLKQKQEQADAFGRLRKYIEKIMIDGELTEEDLERARNEQKEIIGEFKHIKQKLDVLIKETEL